jgi:thymidylate synthase
MSLGFPILTGKKISFNAARTELLWILQGRTDLKYLEDNGVKYWRPDYERSGRTDETLGPVYGKQWRDFNGVDQLKNLVYSIITNPDSRRLMVSAWAPHEMKDMVLPPCHYAFQVYINNGVMDLMWQQRSADVFLGLPYDIISNAPSICLPLLIVMRRATHIDCFLFITATHYSQGIFSPPISNGS